MESWVYIQYTGLCVQYESLKQPFRRIRFLQLVLNPFHRYLSETDLTPNPLPLDFVRSPLEHYCLTNCLCASTVRMFYIHPGNRMVS